MKTFKKLVSCLLVFSMIASMFLTVAAVENGASTISAEDRTGIKFDSVTTQGVTHQDGFYKSEEKLNALPLTYEAWVQVVYADGSFATGGPIMGNRENGDPYWFSLELIAWGQIVLTYGYDGGTKVYKFPVDKWEGNGGDGTTIEPIRVYDNGWHHLAIVHDVENDKVNAYLDGVFVTAMNGGGFVPDAKIADNPIYLGNNAEGANFAFGPTGAFTGYLGDAALYSDVRTATEIASDFANGADKTDANLLAAYEISADDKGKDIADVSANGNDLKWRLPTVIDRTKESYSTLKGLDTLPQTYEMWVYVPLAAKGQYSNILFSNITNGDGIRIDFKENKTAEIRIVYMDGGTWKESVLWEAGLTTDVWAHVAIVHDTAKGEISVYTNGVHKATKALAAPSDSVLANKTFYFPGNGSSAAGQTVPRVLGDMAAYSDVRTAEEIAASYRNGPDVTDENLMFYWDVLGAGKGADIEDKSGNGYTLKYNGDTVATITTTASVAEGGTVTGAGDYACGASVTATATANEGYKFAGWYENGALVSSDATYVFTAAADRALTAKFEKDEVTFEGSVTVSGNITLNGTDLQDGALNIVLFDEKGIITYTTNTNGKFALTVNYTADDLGKQYLYGVLIYGLDQLGLTSTPAQYTVAVTIDANGNITAVASSDGVNPDTALDALNFVIDVPAVPDVNVNITVTPTEGGTATGAGTYAQGTNVTITATPNAGYKFVGWFAGETLLNADATVTFPAANFDLIAKFEKITYSVAVDGQGNKLDPYFVNGAIWVEEDGKLKKPAESIGFLLFNDELTTNRVETTLHMTLPSWDSSRAGLVFALTDNQGDHAFSEGSADVSYYWAFVCGTGKVGLAEMGQYQNWTWLAGEVSLESLGIDASQGITIAAEWDNDGNIKVFVNGILAISAKDDSALQGKLYGMAITDYHPAEQYNDYITSFIAGGALETKDSVNVTADPTEGGTVTGAGEFYVGQSATVTATPNTGYAFAGWYNGETLVSSDATYTFTVTGDCALTAKFTNITYTVTVTPEANGTVTGGGTFGQNASATVVATPNAGYKFAGWYVGTEKVSADATYTFTVTADVALTAKFEKITYSIAVDGNGNILDPHFVSGAIWVEENGSIQMPDGYARSFLLFNKDLGTGTKRIEATIWPNDIRGNGDHRNGIVFALTDHGNDLDFDYVGNDVSYYWACISGWEGRIQVLKMGKDVKWDMISAGGWAKCGTPLAELNLDLTDGVTLAVEWDNAGHIKVFADGKLVEDITDSNPLTGNLYGMFADSTYNSDNPNTYTTCYTSFIAGGALATPDVKVDAIVDPTEGGTVTGTGDYYVGQIVTLTATANEGYKFLGWYNGEYFLTADVAYTLTTAEDITLTAKFEKITYTVDATAGAGGTVAGAGIYDHGASVTLTATPNENYKFLGWFVGEELKSADAEYTFTAEANIALTAKFEKTTHSISVATAAGGDVEGAKEYEYGTEVTLKAIAKEGYKFLGWYENGELVSSDAEFTFTLTEDRYFAADFEELPRFTTNTYEENIIDYKAVGDTITVNHNAPCKVGYISDGVYVTVEAIDNGDGTYSYKIPEGVEEILLVVKGDTNGDGSVNAGDFGWLNHALLGDDALTAKEQFVADFNGDGKVNAGDYGRLNAVLLGKTELTW